MNGSAAGRLRRLRRLLTWLFTGLNAAGLIVLAWFAINADMKQRELGLDADLRPVTAAVTRLLQDDDAVLTAYVSRDEMNDECPQFAILPSGAGRFQAFTSKRLCVPVDPARLQAFADESVRTGTLITGYSRGTGDELVRINVKPFRNGARQYIGAVVAVSDARPAMTEHDHLILQVIAGCVLLVGAVAVAGHVLSGRAIRPAAAALEQQEALLAETAHDLRTPVAALRALAETALKNPEKRVELLPRTVGLAVRMGTIIDGLLVRARLAAGVESVSIQPVRLDQLVATVVRETPAEGAQVTLTTAPSQVLADPALVQRAIGNLLGNALTHGHGPGAQAIVHITVAGGRVVVADHGPGIDAAVAEEKFDRFTSTAGSSGLGLSIVRWVAQAHNGTLRVYNAEEGGAIFELVLPEA